MNIASAAIAFGKFHFSMQKPTQPLFSNALLPKKKGEGKIVWVYCRFLSAM
jgi:hypothetical protein